MRIAKLASLFILVIVSAPVLFVLNDSYHISSNLKVSQPNEPLFIPVEESGVVMSGFQAMTQVNPTLPMNVLVTLGFNHKGLLSLTLNQLQDPFSHIYHNYLSASKFISDFSPSAQEYESYVNYFRSNGLNVTNTYSDRLSIEISSNASLLEKVFHTRIMYFRSNGGEFFAPDSPLSINADFGAITGVTGLSDQFKATISPLFYGSGTSQFLYGADFQSAYQLNKLYQAKGYPTEETVATILWSGTDSGTPVGPFVPSDISTYFSYNLPTGEPRSTFYGVPVGGAPLPGASAASDTTGANIESTLDLEMAGSTAPGATLVEVYGPEPYLNYLDEAFAEILNPSYNTTVDNALSHVVAISNSWAGGDTYDSAWTQYEQEAAARGITVLAASGDGGDTNSVSPNFPATVAFNGYGTLAVGGTQTILSGRQSQNGSGTTGISSQCVWYNTPSTGDGSQGGVSGIYAEPSWQTNSSDANGVIKGASSITGLQSGRGTPDIAGVAANMMIYVSSIPNGGTGYCPLWGTSIASPLDAGLIATMDSYLGTPEGFLNPLIYEIGQEQYQGIYTGPSPFYFVYNGSNSAFNSEKGYNLVDGWGSINAYNFIKAQQDTYQITLAESGLPSGMPWYVNISGMTSSGPLTSSSYSIRLTNGTYLFEISTSDKNYAPNYTNSFTVNGLNENVSISFKPVLYGIEFYSMNVPSGISWHVNLSNGMSSGQVTGSSYIFSLTNGSYSYTIASANKIYAPNVTSGSFTVNGSPLSFEIKFTSVTYTVTFQETGLTTGTPWYVNVSGMTSSGPITSNLYSINLTNGTYSFEISTYDKNYAPNYNDSFTVRGSNSSIPVSFKPVIYEVQFNSINLPSGEIWYVNISGQPGSGPIASGSIYTVNLTNASYLFTIASANKIYAPNLTSGSFTVNGSPLTINVNFIEVIFNVTIQESGLPAGTEWNLTFEGTTYQLTNASYIFAVPNGTYSFFATSHDYKNVSGTITVSGSSLTYTINMEFQLYEVTFIETGLPLGISWYVNITERNGTTYLSGPISGSYYSLSLTNGSYTYTIASANKIYSPSIISSSLTVNGNPYTESITFSLVKYTVTFTESGLLFGTVWYVNLTNGIDSGPITGSSYSFSLVNESYSYTVQTVNKIYSPTSSSGSFTVNGTPLSKPVAFSMVTYALTFKETGLPLGVIWYVNGSDLSGYETSPADISFNLSNGTYSFTVTNLSNYYSTTTHIIVVISGKNVTELVDYYHWAYISGTISPTNANLVINGKSVALTSSGSFNMSVPIGTYHVVISSSGYISYYSNFTLNSGNVMNLTINLKQVSYPSTLTGIDLYIVVGTVIAVIAIGAAVVLIKRRK